MLLRTLRNARGVYSISLAGEGRSRNMEFARRGVALVGMAFVFWYSETGLEGG